MSKKTRYVLGFLFDPKERYVVLIRKNSPDWQKGKLNGVGGKIKSDETPGAAMFREFKEETGVEIPSHEWDPLCLMKGEDWTVYTYSTQSKKYGQVATMDEEEPIVICSLNTFGTLGEEVISNLKWLIPLALDSEVEKPLIIDYKS